MDKDLNEINEIIKLEIEEEINPFFLETEDDALDTEPIVKGKEKTNHQPFIFDEETINESADH